MPSSRRAPKPKVYRVYLAWAQSVRDPLKGMEALLNSYQEERRHVELRRGRSTTLTAVSTSVEFLLVDDPQFQPSDIPRGSKDVFLKVMRHRAAGKQAIEAVPAYEAPPGFVLSGNTGRFVWGGAEVATDVSAQPIPLRYWVPPPKPRKSARKSTAR